MVYYSKNIYSSFTLKAIKAINRLWWSPWAWNSNKCFYCSTELFLIIHTYIYIYIHTYIFFCVCVCVCAYRLILYHERYSILFSSITAESSDVSNSINYLSPRSALGITLINESSSNARNVRDSICGVIIKSVRMQRYLSVRYASTSCKNSSL